MSTLEQNEANLVDAEEINWQLIVLPVVAVFIVVLGGFGYYYYLQNQREDLENQARAALIEAKTPEAMIKVADQFPNADGGTIALLSAADALYAKHDYPGAIAAYQRIIDNATTDAQLRDAAQIGLASADEAAGKAEDATKAYTAVGDRGTKSPYAAFAYFAAARIYEERGDKDSARRFLTQAAGLDPDSPFVKQAQSQLKEMQPPITMQVPPTPAPAPGPAK